MKNLERKKFIIIILIQALCLSACKIQQPKYVGLYIDNEWTDLEHLTDDTVSVVFSDSVKALEKLIPSYQKQTPALTDTVYSEKIKVKSEYVNIYDNDVLQDSVKVLNIPKTVSSDTVYVKNEIIKEVPVQTKTTDTTIANSAAQNDSNRLLKKQINDLKKQQITVTDTVFIEKEVVKTVPKSNKTVDKKTAARLAAQRDSNRLLKKQISEIQNQKSAIPDTMVIEKHVIEEVPYTNQEAAKLDTITLVAYYQIGKLIPIAADSIVNELKAIISTRDVIKINIAGYTDISGDNIINNLITNKRILYFSEMLTDFYNIEKVFYQNFGDTFASNTVLDSERRIVITLILQK